VIVSERASSNGSTIGPGLGAAKLTGVQTGVGRASAHHGEILQGVFDDGSRRIVRGLVTLHRFDITSTVTFRYDALAPLRVLPEHKQKAIVAARLTAAHLGVPAIGGVLVINSLIEEEGGLGSSTSDVVATIRAVSTALGRRLAASDIARLAVEAEEASDSLMFPDRTVLFAHREGRILEDLGGPMPPMIILSATAGAPVPTTSSTLGPASWSAVENYRPLVGLLRHAIRSGDVSLIGKVASRSAALNQQHLPKPHFDAIMKISDEVGAAGLQIAHSGNRIGLIFDARHAEIFQRLTEARSLLGERCGSPRTDIFSTAEVD
jgi:uncharacterized protein involved in propanediol utilization